MDSDDESRLLLSRTLMRKFPEAGLIECKTLDTALQMAAERHPDAVVVHRTAEADGADSVLQLVKKYPHIPVIMVSSIERRQEALDAGARDFILRDEWLRIGTVVQEVLHRERHRPGPSDSRAPLGGGNQL